jgi:hypothetical protein
MNYQRNYVYGKQIKKNKEKEISIENKKKMKPPSEEIEAIKEESNDIASELPIV